MKKLIFIAAIFLISAASFVYSQTNRTYTVINNTGMTVTSVFVSPPNANTWSSNLYTGEKLATTSKFDFIYPYDASNCHYDIRYYDANGKEFILRNVDLCTAIDVPLTLPTEDMKKDNMEK